MCSTVIDGFRIKENIKSSRCVRWSLKCSVRSRTLGRLSIYSVYVDGVLIFYGRLLGPATSGLLNQGLALNEAPHSRLDLGIFFASMR